MAFAVVVTAGLFLSRVQAQSPSAPDRPLPAKAQLIDQKSFNVLKAVPPSFEFNATSGPRRH
ncbi:uncharacterized protein GLRG_05602 [Colletotrichum graminicola M1.001]|uniref:Uncharacterized protein n=1 Tax=Colletotrichum graminicola (strain M1.001 / M2 / FGSC 10212) TaxID=645133 RepID=E3QHX0_COLGM|nr:uncharacterized protein GLRG_05602 [Colletotrichum graminicola M1.001]EFQ30458.1 hypothetical protein GLRG_05602 [Colletotrichum graminicola M1.001]